MSDMWQIVIGAGLEDSFNPCIFMTCAVFILQGIWLQKRSASLSFLRLIFVLTYLSGTMFFNFGPIWTFILQKQFVLTAKIIYFVLGVGSFMTGVLFFKEWFLLRRFPRQEPSFQTMTIHRGLISVGLISIVLGIVSGLLATVWPINLYMTLLGTGVLLKGQWQYMFSFLTVYTLMSAWPLWFLWSFLSIKKISQPLVKIVCASVFFLASSGMILIFK